MTIRVIIIATTIAPELGGISRSVSLLADCVARAGAEVTLLALGGAERTSEFERARCTVKEVYGSSQELIRALKTHLAQDTNETVVHHAGIWTPLNYRIYRVARAIGGPLVCSPRSMLDPWALNHRWLKKKIAWWLYAKRMLQNTTAIHVTSDLERENVEALKLGRPTILVPNGVDLPQPRLEAQSKTASLKRCLFLSRLSQKKGLPDLLHAFAKVAPSDWVLDVVGNEEGDEGSKSRALVDELGIQQRVHFLGFLEGDAKWQSYRNADLFVLPTYSENFGLVIGEAMAAGLPVVTTSAAPWEVLNELGAGWSIEPGVDDLCLALRDAFSRSRSDFESMGMIGQDYVYQTFDWDQVGIAMLESYRNLISGADLRARR